MPITLPPISRRRFLVGTAAAGAGLLLERVAVAQAKPAVDPNRIAILSDVHIDANLAKVDRGTNMADNLSRVVKQVVALDPQPACVLINGDCTHVNASAEDYAAFAELIRPLREAGLTIHLSMGNHDRRDFFWKAFPAEDRADKPVAGRQISLFEVGTIDWYMLDSLDGTNKTPGKLGAEQIDWLRKSLDVRPTKPAIVMTHHHPYFGAGPVGMTDTPALLDVLSPRKQVKALLYGHTHSWNYDKRGDGSHWLNLPPTAYPFVKWAPSGWVDVHLSDKGATAQLICLDEKHPKHLEKLELAWR